MTTQSDELDQQTGVSNEDGQAESGWTSEGERPDPEERAEGEKPAADGDKPETDTPAEGDAEKKQEAEPHADAEAEKAARKKERDRFSAVKNEAETLRKLARNLEEQGLLDRDELAKEVGVERQFLDSVIDKTELPEPGEDGRDEAVRTRMDEDFRNPAVQKGLVRAYGTAEEQMEMAKAFDFAKADNPELLERWNTVAPEDALYLVLDEGKKALADYREFTATGGTPQKMLAEIRRLTTENAALKTAAKPSSQKAETVQPDEETDPADAEQTKAKTPREARLRSLMN